MVTKCEYLREKFKLTCIYCGVRNVPMEVEHIVPAGGRRGGSNRVSNLTLSCRPCNLKKGNQTAVAGIQKFRKELKNHCH